MSSKAKRPLLGKNKDFVCGLRLSSLFALSEYSRHVDIVENENVNSITNKKKLNLLPSSAEHPVEWSLENTQMLSLLLAHSRWLRQEFCYPANTMTATVKLVLQ